MSEYIPIRIEASGPQWWQIKVVDARTGEILPVKRGLKINVPEKNGIITAELTMIIDELDLPEVLLENETQT